MAMGVYDWIRDGVRQAVLLGFSDAVEQLGVPAQQDQKVNEHLVGVLRQPAPLALAGAGAEKTVTIETPAPTRKRLGKTLNQVHKESDLGE